MRRPRLRTGMETRTRGGVMRRNSLALYVLVSLCVCAAIASAQEITGSIVGNIFGSLQSLFGGNITIYTNLCEQARSETYRLMCEHAEQRGANAIISMRYDATELMAGLTEVLCYGTAVIVERDPPGASP